MIERKRCPNCDADMGECNPCPECDHDDGDMNCECDHCEEVLEEAYECDDDYPNTGVH